MKIPWTSWYRTTSVWAIVAALIEIVANLIFLWLLRREES